MQYTILLKPMMDGRCVGTETRTGSFPLTADMAAEKIIEFYRQHKEMYDEDEVFAEFYYNGFCLIRVHVSDVVLNVEPIDIDIDFFGAKITAKCLLSMEEPLVDIKLPDGSDNLVPLNSLIQLREDVMDEIGLLNKTYD